MVKEGMYIIIKLHYNIVENCMQTKMVKEGGSTSLFKPDRVYKNMKCA